MKNVTKLQDWFRQRTPQPMDDVRHYAVFLPLVKREGEWQVLFQVRGPGISQAGEVAFPGGRLEGNETYQEAAIRETMEEIGVGKEQIHLWGELDYLEVEGRVIHCFVGELTLDSLSQLTLSQEVERVFTQPLSQLLSMSASHYDLNLQVDPSSDAPFEHLQGGIHYPYLKKSYSLLFFEEISPVVWGMTARWLQQFLQFYREYEKD